jgi:hypothetical protein
MERGSLTFPRSCPLCGGREITPRSCGLVRLSHMDQLGADGALGTREIWNIAEKNSWSGRLDLNQRPPSPEPGALPDCATPRQGTMIIANRPAGAKLKRGRL